MPEHERNEGQTDDVTRAAQALSGAESESDRNPAPEDSGRENANTGVGDDEATALRREAASRRRRLREVEAERDAAIGERDALRARVDASDRQEVEALASESMVNAADLWLVSDLAALRDDEGNVSPERVGEAVEQAVKDRPHWRKSAPNFDQGTRGTGAPGPSFGEFLKDPRR